MREQKSGISRAVEAVALLLGVLAMGCVTTNTAIAQRGQDELRLVVQDGVPPEDIAGEWEAKGDWLESRRSKDHVQLTVVREGAGRMESRSTTVHDFEFDRAEDGWSMERPAGAIRLGDDVEVGRTFTVEPDAEFLARVEEAGMAKPSPWELLRLVCSGIAPDYVAGVNEGSRGFTWAEIIKLHSAGVTLDFVRAVREPADVAEAGDEDQAETPPSVAYSVDEMVMLSFRGVSAEYITSLRDAGYRLPAGVIADMSFRGVNASFASKVRKAGYDLSGAELANLTFRGVNADYMVRLREAGYDFSAKELVDLSFRGVSTDYAAALVEPGYEPLSAAEIIKLQFRGVDPELIKALRPVVPEKDEAVAPAGP